MQILKVLAEWNKVANLGATNNTTSDNAKTVSCGPGVGASPHDRAQVSSPLESALRYTTGLTPACLALLSSHSVHSLKAQPANGPCENSARFPPPTPPTHPPTAP